MLAKAVLDHAQDPNITKGKLVEMGGYGKVVQDTPEKALGSKGFKQALAEYGLTEELITTALVDDIKAKPKSRVKELGLGADILGMRKPQGDGNGGNTYNLNVFTSEQGRRIAERFLADQKPSEEKSGGLPNSD